MAKQVFYDPQRKRWGRLRILLDVLGLVVTGLILFFIYTVVFQTEPLPPLLMPEQKRNLHALKEKEHRHRPKVAGTHRKRGAGKALVAAAAAFAEERGIEQLVVSVHPGSRDAARFFAHEVLPRLGADRRIIESATLDPMDVPEEAF